jgi:TonB family protein
VVDSGDVSERTYSVPEIPAAFQGEFWPADVTRPARIASTRAGPRYPTAMREGGVRGSVSVAFVVDSTGEVLVDSMQVVASSNEAFTQSVRQTLRGMTFAAAELDGRKVRQVMQLTFGCGFSGDSVHGDVVTTALGVTRRIP